jgi:hypothetical protein
MISVGCYQAQVKTLAFSRSYTALLLPAKQEDMPLDWDFDWKGLWEETNFNHQGLTKFVFQSNVFGLVRYSIYPLPDAPKSIFIDQIEAAPSTRGEGVDRLIEPVGKWLLWYVAQVAFSHCVKNSRSKDDYLVILESLSSAFDYYRDKIKMEYLEPGCGAPGEDAYIFAFSWDKASKFCKRQERQYGLPLKVN